MKRRLLRTVFLLSAVALAAAQGQTRDLPLREGDRILVKLWMDTVFADTARIQERGVVILPRVGPVSIDGIPASRVADSVRSSFARVFRELTVEVTPLRKVTVIGDVRSPNVYYFDPHTTVRDAIAMAGGITEIGRPNRVTIYRDTTRTRLRDWQKRNDDDVVVRSGEVIVADREPWIKRNIFTVLSGTSVLVSIVLTLTRL